MEKFLTSVAIFAFAIPTTAIVTAVIILIILALILLLAAILSSRTRRKSRRPPSPGGWNQQGEIRSVYPFQPPPVSPPSPLPQQSVGWGHDSSTQQPAGWGHDPSTQQSADRGQHPSTPQPVGWGQQTPSTLPPTQGITEGPIIPQRENRQPESAQNQPTTIPPNPTGNVWPDSTVANTGIAPTQITGARASTPATPSTRARFILRSEKGDVLREYPLEKPEISIGRAPNSDILLSKDKLASRRHATIRYENGIYVLHDEHSANGTFVNGQQLEESTPRVLQDGDHVSIGEYELTFHGLSTTSSAEDMPTREVHHHPIPTGAAYGTREDDEDVAVPVYDDFSTRSVDEGVPDPFAQWIQAVPAPPPANSSAPPVQPGSAPPSRPGVQYSPAVQESSEKHSAIPPVPAKIASPPVFAPAPKSTTPVYSPEQLRFTAFHPKEVIVETWNTLLVYAHIEPVVEAINKDAQRFKAELGAAPRKISAPATQLLLRETNISIVPECKGVTFNPKRFTFKWLEDWHRASFRFQAKPELAGSAGNGRVNIFAGPLLVGTLKMALLFEEKDTSLPAHSGDIQETANLYKQIFASYSHDDSLIVLTCRDVFKTLGYNTLIDIDTLRAGQKFSDALKRMIDAADIFQLFWSDRSAKSTYVAEEWEYALGLNRGEGFVRPVYWEVPMAQPPEKLAPLHFAYLPAYTFTRQQSPSR
ncbi:MAG TPA: FHA domain-containing protein [Ktedonobacteraceae bacterium]|nr:FHA domain-containing protein [Ktedonobacteraceae bacterium]